MQNNKQIIKNNNLGFTLIQENISLKDKNWFQTGGNAQFYAEPINQEEFILALNFANKNNLDLFILGQGANILISDEGFQGLVIRPKLKKIEFQNIDANYTIVSADSGVDFQELINFCLENKLVGLEEFSGIPGTVGGSVYINIHYFEYLLNHFLVGATVVQAATGKIFEVDCNWFQFGYNKSTLLSKEFFLVSAKFKLKKVDAFKAAYAKGRSDEIIRHRLKRYPAKGTCGSFFRNFYENEVTFESAGKKIIFVAYYLDKIGVKGNLQVGNAIVSYQHANMLVNLGNATSTEIISLAKAMQQLVKDEFNIIPQAECQLVGFKEHPLIKC